MSARHRRCTGRLLITAVIAAVVTACGGGVTPAGRTGTGSPSTPTPSSSPTTATPSMSRTLTSPPTLQLSPGTGPVGTVVRATGTVADTTACSVVRVTVARAAGAVAALERYAPVADGRYTASFTVPALPIGRAVVEAYCTASAGAAAGRSHATQAAFTVTPARACSASRLPPQVAEQAGLPAAVAQMRADLAAAAVACDYELLATTLADRHGTGVQYTFGAPGDPAAQWREAEEGGHGLPPMFALRTVLGLSHGVLRLDNGHVLYEWPAAFASEHPTDAQLTEIADSGLYPLRTLREWADTGNGYLGYRVVIGDTGDWMAFVAGD